MESVRRKKETKKPRSPRVIKIVAEPEILAGEPVTGYKIKLQLKSLLPVMALILGLVVLGGAYYFVAAGNLSPNSSNGKPNNANIIAQVSKLVVVNNPAGSMLATVTDKTKLQNQQFFASAENGDYVVFFPAEKKAVLYRASINKIVEIAPINNTGSSIK